MKIKNVTIILLLLIILFSVQMLKAQGPVQLSLINSIQIVPEKEAVTAFRLAIYGKNTHTQYVDIGIVTQNTNGQSKGIQWSFVGLQDDFTGWQAATVFNYSPGNVKGLMTSAVNYTGYSSVWSILLKKVVCYLFSQYLIFRLIDWSINKTPLILHRSNKLSLLY